MSMFWVRLAGIPLHRAIPMLHLEEDGPGAIWTTKVTPTAMSTAAIWLRMSMPTPNEEHPDDEDGDAQAERLPDLGLVEHRRLVLDELR